MRAFILIVLSATVMALSACSEEKPKPPAGSAMDAVKTASDPVKSASDKVTEGAKNPAGALPQGVQQALPTFDNFSQTCAQCHDADDVKRYETTFLPMYQMMFDPKAWVNPNAYGNVMQPMMDPETYTKWYNAWSKMMMPMPGAQQPQQ